MLCGLLLLFLQDIYSVFLHNPLILTAKLVPLWFNSAARNKRFLFPVGSRQQKQIHSQEKWVFLVLDESKVREWMWRERSSFCRVVPWWEGHLSSLDSLYSLEIWKVPLVGDNVSFWDGRVLWALSSHWNHKRSLGRILLILVKTMMQ